MPPSDVRRLLRTFAAALLLAGAAAVGLASELPVGGAVAAVARQDARPVSIRVQWGGGKPQAWVGSITVVGATAGVVPEWRTVCSEPDAAAMLHEADGAILVHEPRPVATDGVELSIAEWRTARLRVRLAAAAGGHPETTADVAVADVLAAAVQQPLDGDGNRLTIRQCSGDSLRVTIADADATGQAALRRPGERMRLRVDPLLPVRTDHAGRYELRVRLLAGLKGEAHDAQAVPIVPREPRDDLAGDRRLTRFEPVDFEITLPAREGTCDVELQAVEVGSLRWARPLASRTVQFVAVADRPAAAPPTEWKLVHEVDPGSPRLHERLRRLPGAGRSQGGMPAIPLPAMPLPTFTRPNVSLPNVAIPGVPLPNVPLPNVPLPKIPSVPPVSSMVPRFSGLLVAGHSTVEPHTLGPMLLLPPAKAAGEPSWEGIVVAGAQPGIPHAVEIDFPSDQEAVVGASVLELDAAGALVEVRHAGGFEARRDPYAATAELRRHRFVFWPTTRNPLVVVSNPSTRRPAMVGKVRVLAGPTRLPVASPPAAVRARQAFALWPTPDFTVWGGVERIDEATGRGFNDWGTHLAGIRHSAEWLAARGAGGALVAVYAQGAAAWPSPLSRQAPRWGSGAAAETDLDPQAKDVLGLLCRVYAAEGLRLVPGMAFDSPLPTLETLLAAGGAESIGIVCVGRDGRPRRTPYGSHYNILDPRVQQAVEEQVRELAGRLRGAAAADGVALLLGHDGWLHLPGTTVALDDATFTRFLESVGTCEPEGGSDRFARRAEMVEGPLRDMWLEWRADVVAAFHARLATVLAEADPRFTLHIVPTTLLAAGDLATRSRPRLGTEVAAGDVLREAGLDPLRSTAHPQVVFSTPHVHTAADGLVDRGLVTAANLASPVTEAARSARRRGIAIVEQPVSFDLRPLASAGPFGAATPAGRCPIHAVPATPEAGRALAESLVAADAEIVFDMRLALAELAADDTGMTAFSALPAGVTPAVADVPPPVVIRMLPQAAGATWMRVINVASAPGRIRIGLDGRAAGVLDAADRSRIELGADGVATVPVGPWCTRTLLVDGGVTVRSARIEYDEPVQASVAARIQDLRRRRAALEMPQPLEVLDNPGFEVGSEPLGAAFSDRSRAGAVTGWELVEQRRGTLELVPGMPVSGAAAPGRGLAFSSVNGLASLHSNPFPSPATGRLSVAVWLRVEDGAPQPPLRIAIEGLHEDREYYRFAAVGGLAGGRPLTTEWAQFVLPVDDLPTAGLESLRVRFDLLGPGRVLIDDVRVLDLAFEESQRVQLSRLIARFEQSLATRDIGGCVVGLDGHWPRFLAEFVSDAAVARMAAVPVPAVPPAPKPAAPAGMLDRVRGWWQ